MSDRSRPIAIFGAGAFGTALACVLSEDGTPVHLYGRDAAAMRNMQTTRRNPRLPGITLSGGIAPMVWPAGPIEAHTILLAVPSAAQLETAERLRSILPGGATVVMCAKGLDRDSGRTLTDGLARLLPDNPLAVLSGPGFAADIAAGLPTAMTLAASTETEAETVAGRLSRKSFRLYATNDMVGVQLGGALKNVLAIAAGVVIGAGLGDSARAALIARGLAELTRFVVACGGRPDTAAGLSGLGDLVLTATSTQSRNYRYGIAIGHGEPPANAGTGAELLVEGAAAAITAARAARALSVAMPITDAVAAIAEGTADVPTIIDRLLSRPLRRETS
ncbi:NAD(P)H-dependent glycerol-3-phosphate dehydrogenase [Pseudohoeflea coraliihabitans]|uniref:Glycerol-3-phosphate dehydrogenase [NAD(P)+] n=1 Tax=Pseudohoeflea coraliihabitans TaxID=2860393 RepID=A0ABS6WNZ1_9HYPH|nr:NAD(P)H-dependent glycerol-3-phosphate dehydrogenase [Pseudohoeflea sp. DP4N28-3]MBW3096794.1 NAD(P)-dependent glycerol-3-phosphate dehydrogenase [Pseudohoeflea sp. DP4N28-3]